MRPCRFDPAERLSEVAGQRYTGGRRFSVRLALKITWITMISTGVGLGVQAKLRFDRELQLIDDEMRRDQRLLGRAMLPLLEESHAAGGANASRHAMSAAYEGEREVALHVVPVHSLPAEVQQDLEIDGEAVVADASVTPERLTTYLQLRLPGTEPRALKLSEAMTSKEEFADAALREFLLLFFSLLAITTVVGAIAGHRLVGRRVERLIRAARAVSAGDYSVPLEDDGDDAIGTLSREMSTMTRQLDTARAQASSDAQRRGQLVERLRHADRLATVGALASRVAHDVGTPLNVVSARARLIADGDVTGDQIVHNATIVAEQSDRIAERIRELLGFSRQEQSARVTVDVDALISDTVTLLDSLARLHGVRLEPSENASLHVRGVQLQLQQALVNLVVNAIHAAPRESPVVIEADTVVVSDPPAGIEPGRFVRISVRDRGAGITPELQRTVFEPFFTTKSRNEGTGLGLPIALGIARDHGGFISIEAGSDHGTDARMFIPEQGSSDA